MDLLRAKKDSIAQVATKHLSAERLITSIGVACSRNPDLLKCTPMSVLKAAIAASQLGLDPSGTLGSAYLVPYWNKNIRANEAVLIPGYRGLVDLLRRHIDAQVEARVVYRDDRFRVTYGTEPKIEHVPSLEGSQEDGDIIAAYSVFTWPDGRKSFEVLSRGEIDKVRASSRAGESGPWKQWFSEMCKKTAVRRGVKLQPLSPEAASLIQTVDEEEHGGFEVVADVEATGAAAAESTTERLKAKLGDPPSVPPGPDGDHQTRAEESGKAAASGSKVNNAAPPAAKRRRAEPEQPSPITDDDLSALDDAEDIRRD